MSTTTIPEHLTRSIYWRGTLYMFSNCWRLNPLFNTEIFDFQAERINVAKLKRISAPWSESEKFMLKLALHLYNPNNKVDLSDMDYLDSSNLEIALDAMRLRYSR